MSHHRKTLTLALGLGIVLATVLGPTSPAQAQYAPGYYPPPPPPPPRGVYRSGLIVGGSIGLGGFWYSDCNGICGGGLSGEIHIGGMIAPRLALMGDFWATGHRYNDDYFGSGTTYNGIYTLAAQYWATDNLWLKGGLGFGQLALTSDYYYGSLDDSGFAFMLAAGIEVVQAYNYAMDLQIRYGNATYSGAGTDSAGDTSVVTFMIGFNWY